MSCVLSLCPVSTTATLKGGKGCEWQNIWLLVNSYARHVELNVEETNGHAGLASIQVKEQKNLFLQIY